MTEIIDIPEAPTTEDIAPPPVSQQTHLAEVISRYETIKANAANAAKEGLRQAADIDNRRKSLEFRLHEAEQRLNIVAGSAAQYRDSQRQQAVGRLLMGDTSVDLEAVAEADPMDKLTAADLKLGIAELRNQRTELSREWEHVKARIGKQEHEFYRAHAVINAARYQLARVEVQDAWVQLMAAESAAAKFAIHPGTPVLVNAQTLTPLVLPAADGTDAVADVRRPGVRVGGSEISGERIIATTTIRNHANELTTAFQKGGN